MLARLAASKTFYTGLTGIVAAIGGYMTQTMDIGTALQTVLTSLLAIFLRDGMAKG